MRRFRKKLKGWATKILDLPHDVVLDMPRVTMIGNVQLYIENHRGVMSFSGELLELGLSRGHLEVRGKDLVIRAILTEEVLVEGTIEDVKYVV